MLGPLTTGQELINIVSGRTQANRAVPGVKSPEMNGQYMLRGGINNI